MVIWFLNILLNCNNYLFRTTPSKQLHFMISKSIFSHLQFQCWMLNMLCHRTANVVNVLTWQWLQKKFVMKTLARHRVQCVQLWMWLNAFAHVASSTHVLDTVKWFARIPSSLRTVWICPERKWNHPNVQSEWNLSRFVGTKKEKIKWNLMKWKLFRNQ